MTLIYIGMDTDVFEADFKKFLIDRQQEKLKDEGMKVLVVGSVNGLSMSTKLAIESLGKIMVIDKPDIPNVFEFNNFHQPMTEIYLEPQVKHGAYRQFIKHDKRKNLKVNK
tara:strand:+ start:314 stop:646 length:333 start_codon:yes stop_codon:yes gene_type:complete